MTCRIKFWINRRQEGMPELAEQMREVSIDFSTIPTSGPSVLWIDGRAVYGPTAVKYAVKYLIRLEEKMKALTLAEKNILIDNGWRFASEDYIYVPNDYDGSHTTGLKSIRHVLDRIQNSLPHSGLKISEKFVADKYKVESDPYGGWSFRIVSLGHITSITHADRIKDKEYAEDLCAALNVGHKLRMKMKEENENTNQSS